ncbi:MAG TPA: phosphoribosylamine--glycine ligase, partial [Coxiellaceae bacterium]|nr:phosphoribosylamine--glycine ligase [Coxiellaceae bacterium]
MKLLIVGNGGREHALAWKAAQSSQVTHIFVAPGNAGTALETKTHNITIDVTDLDALITFATDHAIDLTLVGPEIPLSLGIVDRFQAAKLRCFGPSQQAARLESSKHFCKEFLLQHHIPTAKFKSFVKSHEAIKYCQHQPFPLVIKADGLAAGKGVVIVDNLQTAEDTLRAMLDDQQFGEAGTHVVIEEFLTGREISFIVISDGETVLPLATSQDHKCRDAGNQGPNTGGMGAFSPALHMSPALEERIMNTIILPTLRGMKAQSTPYTGFLYAGLMINANDEPYVLEYNCRLGDPETQPLMMRLQSDLIALCEAALNRTLSSHTLQWDPRPALGVVLCSGGYPEQYEKGFIIEGLNQPLSPDAKIFHAGTTQVNGKTVTHGGRVLCATSLGDSLSDAHQKA